MNQPNFEPISRTFDLDKVRKVWDKMLPTDLSGLTFLDVGCWSGGFCKVALEKGAKRAVGIDMVRSSQMHDIEFVQCDVLSERFLQLESFDIVLCKGVIYHVDNPISFLFRLKSKTRQLLCLGTAVMTKEMENNIPNKPYLELWKPNQTNWWLPNVKCVEEMLKACQFKNIRLMQRVDNSNVKSQEDRAIFNAVPANITCQRLYPRGKKLMETESF